MPKLEVSQNNKHEDFLEETQKMMPVYLSAAARVLTTLTLESLQNEAAVHPDGFLKLQIGPKNFAAEGQVRLHFWISGRLGTEQPHSHPWHLASYILSGIYSEYNPKISESDSGLKKYKISYPEGRDMRVGVEQVGSQQYDIDRGLLHNTLPGELHDIPAGEVHMSSPNGKGGITLAIMSPRFENHAHFYAKNDMPYKQTIDDNDIDKIMSHVHSMKGDL